MSVQRRGAGKAVVSELGSDGQAGGLSHRGRCRVCGCTEREPCNPPCAWDDDSRTLCTNCALAVEVMVEWAYAARRPNAAALMREYKRMMREEPCPYAVAGPEIVLLGGGGMQ